MADEQSEWILAAEEFSEDIFGVDEDEVPDNVIDPEDGTLSLVNKHYSDTKIFTVTVRGKALFLDSGQLSPGKARDKDVTRDDITTLIVKVGPRRVLEVCRVELPAIDVNLVSDIQVWRGIEETPDAVEIGFPLQGGPFLCSQSSGGALTHSIHESTYFAVDLDCPVGTPVLAVESGIVCEVKDDENCSGIDCSFLFRHNQVSVRHSNGTMSEYVHISRQSSRVKTGDVVRRGDVLCTSGDVGFSPTPHLHLQVVRETDGKSLPLRFTTRNAPFEISEGRGYTAEGLT